MIVIIAMTIKIILTVAITTIIMTMIITKSAEAKR